MQILIPSYTREIVLDKYPSLISYQGKYFIVPVVR